MRGKKQTYSSQVILPFTELVQQMRSFYNIKQPLGAFG